MIAEKLTTEAEFREMCDMLGPCELIRGRVIRLSPGRPNHSRVSANVAGLLYQWVRRTKIGRIWTNEAGILVESDPDTVRAADVAFVSYGRLAKDSPDTGFPAISPELVVEVAGRGQTWREIVEKAAQYLRMGVDLVWILDPDDRSLHVFSPREHPRILSDQDIVSNEPVLPGFECRVSEMFDD